MIFTQLEPYQIVRELISGTMFFINIYLVWVFVFSEHGALKNFREWKADPGIQASTVLGIYFVGAMISRGWEWALALLTNLNISYDYPKAEYLLEMVRQSWISAVVAGILIVVGGYGCVYTFNERRNIKGAMATVTLIAIVLPFLIFISLHGLPWNVVK